MKSPAFYRITVFTLLTLLAHLGWGASVKPVPEKDTAVRTRLWDPQDRKEKAEALPKTPPSEAPQWKVPSKNKTSAPNGGADTGGGNALGSGSVEPREITELVKKSKEPALYIFRRLEIILTTGLTSGALKSLGERLFKGPITIFDKLREVQLRALETGPCLDSEGGEVDASAANAPELCFSSERLARRLNADSLQGEVLAMVIHEVSHTLKPTEGEAILLQNIVKASLTNDPYRKIPGLVNDYRLHLQSAESNLRYFLDHAGEMRISEVCSLLATLQVETSSLVEKNMRSLSDLEKNGISYSGAREITLLNGAVLKAINANTYCLGNLPAYKKSFDAFGSKAEMDLKEFQAAALPGGGAIPLPAEKIRRINLEQMGPLMLEIEDIHAAIAEALRNL